MDTGEDEEQLINTNVVPQVIGSARPMYTSPHVHVEPDGMNTKEWLKTLDIFLSQKRVFFDDQEKFGSGEERAALNKEWKELKDYAMFDQDLCKEYTCTHKMVAPTWYAWEDTS